MKTLFNLPQPLFFTLFFALFVLLQGCDFCTYVGCSLPLGSPDTAPNAEYTRQDRNLIYQTPETIVVYHGSGCAESRKDGEEMVLHVEDSLQLPPYATNATVFLNGWQLKYLDSDHDVNSLGTAIGNIRLERNMLKWRAGGELSDKNFDDSYSWCYTYTVIAWNQANLDLAIDQNDGRCLLGDSTKTNSYMQSNEGMTTALSTFANFIQNPEFASGKQVAILPRGFGFRWECNTDNNLLQIAYNLGHSEKFIEHKKNYVYPAPPFPNDASRVDLGIVSWETSAILKDNKGRRSYDFGDIVSAMGGGDVGIIQPPFSILPREDDCDGSFGGSGVRTEEFIIENIPYRFAVPMLSGWELGYLCDDENVKEIGMWIDRWSYQQNGPISGTLRYTLSSILSDKDNFPEHYEDHKVTVLGMRPIDAVVSSEKVPDLLPFSPSGTEPTSFCRMEDGGRQLRVTVKNQGTKKAEASKTRVFFNNTPVILDTPPIPAGELIDLLFKVPSGCFSPDCSFRITVDSANEVDESNYEGNNEVNGGCIG